MGKTILAFIAMSVLVGVGIQVFRSLTGGEKWALIKTVSYAMMCSAIALIALFTIVVLF